MNKQIADFSSQQKPKTKVKTFSNDEYNDDAKSEVSYISNSQFSAIGSSNWSSALKKPPGIMQVNQSQCDTSSISSQITYEEGFPNAERNALDEEEKARRRKEEKEYKMQEFMKQTKKKAQEKLIQEKSLKQAQLEKEIKEKERILKAKEYAKVQRQVINKNTKKSSTNVTILSTSDPAGIHTNYHAQIKREQQQNNDLNEVIPEVSETDEREKVSEQMSDDVKEQTSNFANNDQLNLVDLYQRIDQEELEKLGVYDKESLGENAIKDLHEYSMLQRFRQNKDFKQPDKYKPKTKKSQKQQYSTNMTDKENKWWISGGTNSNQSEYEQKMMVEKTRYLKALKSLVKEKGGKLDGGEIPNLCSCGALSENLKEMKIKDGSGVVSMCASNCQFYKNQKDYEKALRDILHSISLFK